ncbi:DUF2993 domain-containing protein [Streptomyces sp. NPDC089799]|uniref:LmeA family phospholipid-binding protein n=1 Tax=Streptomyces sp. NPDC089799 TaxID=3155066 RepID=UPI003448B98A
MRVVRALVIAGVVLGGLFVAADRLAVGYAEDRIADRIDSSGHGGADGTEVEISGFPFLTQALDHRLERVDVRLKGVRTTTSDGHRMSISQLETRFHDVKLSDDYSGGTASRADGTARVTYGDLDRASQSGATVAYGGSPGKLKVTAGVSLLGRTITRSVISTITLVDGDTVRVRADAVPGEGIPGVEELVREKTDFDRDLEGLPAGLTLSSLTSDKDGLALTLTGAAVSLTSR